MAHVHAAVQADGGGQGVLEVRDVGRGASGQGVEAEQRVVVAGAGGGVRGVVVLGEGDELADDLDLGRADLLGGVVEAVGGGVATLGGALEVAVRCDDLRPAAAGGVTGRAGKAFERTGRGTIG